MVAESRQQSMQLDQSIKQLAAALAAELRRTPESEHSGCMFALAYSTKTIAMLCPSCFSLTALKCTLGDPYRPGDETKIVIWDGGRPIDVDASFLKLVDHAVLSRHDVTAMTSTGDLLIRSARTSTLCAECTDQALTAVLGPLCHRDTPETATARVWDFLNRGLTTAPTFTSFEEMLKTFEPLAPAEPLSNPLSEES